MMKADLAENTEKVLHFIQKNPGCHLRRIKKELNMSLGSVQHHLIQLEKLQMITSIKRGLYRSYFLCGLFEENEKDVLRILGQETPRNIVLFIIEQKNPTQTDIANRLGLSPASVNWQIRRLLALKIACEAKEGKYKRYRLTRTHRGDYARHILTMLKNYYPDIWSTWNDRWAELFLSFSKEE